MNRKKRWLIRMFTVGYCFYMSFFAAKFQFMTLNVFLAYIPLELGFHVGRVRGKLFYLASFLWLLFYPNIPYLLTDFFHLEVLSVYQKDSQIFSSSLEAWWAFCLLVLGIVPYYFYGIESMLYLIKEWKKRSSVLKNFSVVFYMMLINLLSSLAIYVGRFQRLHSVHLFTKPVQTIQLVFFQWSLNKFVFVMMFTALQSVLTYLIFEQPSENGKKWY